MILGTPQTDRRASLSLRDGTGGHLKVLAARAETAHRRHFCLEWRQRLACLKTVGAEKYATQII
jgi:hypothetical protein